ncbi:histone-lysine N-methyltransferase SETMAR [Trichonephila clavipes]|nr:histone-lysine N-methyltransferase SETMAR [Trichonephila clavipes]
MRKYTCYHPALSGLDNQITDIESGGGVACSLTSIRLEQHGLSVRRPIPQLPLTVQNKNGRKCQPSGSNCEWCVYEVDTVTANYVQFWFRQFRSGILDVKDAPLTGRLVIENIDKITEIIKVDRYVSSRSIAQELKIDH